MTPKHVIQKALKYGDQFSRALADMKDAPLTRPGEWGGNHPMWIAGHLAVVEGRMHKNLFGVANPLEHWKPLFDWGTEPMDDASAYPPFEEVLGQFTKLRSKTLEYLEALDDAELDQPVKVPAPDFPIFDTVGNTLLTIAVHQCAHAGEAFVVRRAAGKTPFFTPTPALRAF
jgi:DinB superfamily